MCPCGKFLAPSQRDMFKESDFLSLKKVKTGYNFEEAQKILHKQNATISNSNRSPQRVSNKDKLNLSTSNSSKKNKLNVSNVESTQTATTRVKR